ncbi:MAG: hypothetical protein KU28_04055 [Sulfurovum sp. PC08-66]|nr:MAG: hypothetical protein KU28_04055 [Sulfurovum sp. PC08-66]
MRYLILFLTLSIFAFGECDDNADKLAVSYPQISHCHNNRIVFTDGTTMLYDDGKKKSFEELLNHADIEDMFSMHYPRGKNSYEPPAKDFDPGRIRNEDFTKKIYGSTSRQIQAKLTTIPFVHGKRIQITTINGVDKKLQAVGRELEALPQKYHKYFAQIGGTYYWRPIAGTNRLSSHSFGIAIDINVKYSAYWRWSKGAYRYQNQIPPVIVEIFEKHGFIWGGKWYHYDTMHFEYRPELLR